MIRPEVIDEVVALQARMEITTGFVYLMRCGLTNFYKIGRAKDVNNRRKAIQLCNPHTIVVVWKIRTTNMQRLEQRMHRMFAAKRVHGEWFLLTEEDVARFKGEGS